MGGVDSRVTPGVGANVLSVPASTTLTDAANAMMNAIDDFMLLLMIVGMSWLRLVRR
jgi:hypothetical protein